jgi:hypothetical protein
MDEHTTRMVESIRLNMRGSDWLSLAIVESGERMERAIAAQLTPDQYVAAATAILELCVQTKSMIESQPVTDAQLYALRATSNVHAAAAVLLLDRADAR